MGTLRVAHRVPKDWDGGHDSLWERGRQSLRKTVSDYLCRVNITFFEAAAKPQTFHVDIRMVPSFLGAKVMLVGSTLFVG